MTNPIGTGTANIVYNTAVDERLILGQAAFQANKSTSAFLRQLVLAGLQQMNPEAAERIKAVRRAYYGSALLGIFLAALVYGHDDMLRARRAGRVREAEIEEEVVG